MKDIDELNSFGPQEFESDRELHNFKEKEIFLLKRASTVITLQ